MIGLATAPLLQLKKIRSFLALGFLFILNIFEELEEVPFKYLLQIVFFFL